MRFLIALLALLLAACSPGASPKPSSVPKPTVALHILRGTIQLATGAYASDPAGTACFGTAGYDDIQAGTEVIVKNASGTVIATGPLEPGVPDAAIFVCTFRFSVNLPDAPFYQLAIGHRGAPTYSKTDLQAAGWEIALALG